MADVRFEIRVNGEHACTAGVAGCGAINAIITRLRRTTKYLDEAKQRDPEVSVEDWTRERIDIGVNAIDWERDVSARWLSRDLVPGDEVTIRVLGPGPIDSPKSSTPPDAEWR